MKQSPKEIYTLFSEQKIDRNTAIIQLKSIIQNSKVDRIRIEALKHLESLKKADKDFYRLLENLLISENSERIKIYVIQRIESLYGGKAFNPLEWSYTHESSINCQIYIINSLGKIRTDQTKGFLIQEIQKYINQSKKDLDKLDDKKLSELLINCRFYSYFKKKILASKIDFREGYVRELDLSSIYNSLYRPNIINVLPKTMIFLKGLEKIDLSFNNLRTLPIVVVNISNLRELNLNNNLLTFLPTSIGALKSLEHLSLNNNKFKKVPHSIGKLESLISLEIRNNYLTSFRMI